MTRLRPWRFAALTLLCVSIAACGSAPSSPRPSATGSLQPATTAEASTSQSADPSDAPPAAVAGPPVACYSLGDADCRRAAAAAIAELTDADAEPVYLQVGPFYCRAGERCPTTLAARPEGDVIIEFPDVPAIAIHLVMAADGQMQATRGETFGVILPPSSAALSGSGPMPFELGHCGLWSGIDVDGSWWDPVGPIDGDHPDSINAARATLAFADPTHANLATEGGLLVQLLRRSGPKHLPMCQ